MAAKAVNRSDSELLVAVYDQLRTARMSAVYYEIRLRKAGIWNLIFDISAAVIATGSGVAGWAIWGTEIGKYVWGSTATVASGLAILRPILHMRRKSQEFAKMDERWHSQYLNLEQLALDILREDRVSQAAERQYKILQKHYVQLSSQDEKPQHKATRNKAQERVNEERPAETLRVPPLTDA
jgi:hypothetical protein